MKFAAEARAAAGVEKLRARSSLSHVREVRHDSGRKKKEEKGKYTHTANFHHLSSF